MGAHLPTALSRTPALPCNRVRRGRPGGGTHPHLTRFTSKPKFPEHFLFFAIMFGSLLVF